MKHIALVTSFFSTPYHSNRAPYNEQLFLSLNQLFSIEIIRPIAWTDLLGYRFRGGAKVVLPELWNGIHIQYPTYFFVPRVGHRFNGNFYSYSIAPSLSRIRTKPDVVYTTWAFPDAYASMLYAKKLKVPLVVRLHGGDINVVSKLPGVLPKILEVLDYASLVVCPSYALKAEVVGLGGAEHKIEVLYSGIDTDKFFPRKKEECCAALGLESGTKRIIYVGNFKREKGVNDLVEAASLLRSLREDFEVLLVGKGKEDRNLAKEITRHSLEKHVKLIGELSHDQLGLWMGASDTLCLPSYSEGMPNVVLEALSSDINVVATNVGGIPEAFVSPHECLVEPGDIDGLALKLQQSLFEPNFHTKSAVDIQSYDSLANTIRQKIEAFF
jgi:glycosyltransferase involved in cell wall biosynthesis